MLCARLIVDGQYMCHFQFNMESDKYWHSGSGVVAKLWRCLNFGPIIKNSELLTIVLAPHKLGQAFDVL